MRANMPVFVLAFLAASMGITTADSLAPPTDRTVESANKRYVLAVLQRGTRGANAAIRNLYSQSGLYRAGGSDVLWTLPDYDVGVLVAGDGIHAITFDGFPSIGPGSPMRDHGLEFFENGRSLKKYSVGGIIGPKIPLEAYTASHYRWLKDIAFDASEKFVRLDTITGARQFEVATGAVVSPR